MEITKEKTWKIKQILLSHHFTLKISDRGDLFSIPWTTYFSKVLPNSVNHGQDWMPIKFNPNLMNKLHPNVHKYNSCRRWIFCSLDKLRYLTHRFVTILSKYNRKYSLDLIILSQVYVLPSQALIIYAVSTRKLMRDEVWGCWIVWAVSGSALTVKMEITLQRIRRAERLLLTSDHSDQGTCIQHLVIWILNTLYDSSIILNWRQNFCIHR